MLGNLNTPDVSVITSPKTPCPLLVLGDKSASIGFLLPVWVAVNFHILAAVIPAPAQLGLAPAPPEVRTCPDVPGANLT